MKWRRRKIEGKNNKLKKAYNLNNGLEIYDFIVLKYCALKIYKIKVKTKKMAFKCKEYCSLDWKINLIAMKSDSMIKSGETHTSARDYCLAFDFN